MISKRMHTDIVHKKSRTYIVAKSKKISAFLPCKMSLSYQISGRLGTHGKSTQKTHQDSITALLGDPEQSLKQRCIEAVQEVKEACMDQ